MVPPALDPGGTLGHADGDESGSLAISDTWWWMGVGGWVITASSAKPTTRIGHGDRHDADPEAFLQRVGGRITRSSVAAEPAGGFVLEADATEDAVIGSPTLQEQERCSGQVVLSPNPLFHNRD